MITDIKSTPDKNGYKNLMKQLGLNETYTTHLVKKHDNDTYRSNLFPLHGYNFMADLCIMPADRYKKKYLLVVVDMWSREFDMEAMTNKQSQTILDAFLKIKDRGILDFSNMAYIRTDCGSEFKSVFNDYMYNNNVYHSFAVPGRHSQMAPVDNLIKLLSRFFIAYMNKKEEESGKIFKQWTELIDTLRVELNKLRKLPDGNPWSDELYPQFNSSERVPKFNIGDMVLVKLDRPKNSLGDIQSFKFRVGDYKFDTTNPSKIKNILYYENNIRYLVEGYDASYTEEQLRFAPRSSV